MIWIAIGCLLLGLLVGTAGMKAAGRFVGRAWRPGAGMLALAAFLAAAYLAVREAWPAALLLGAFALLTSLGVRSSRRAPHARDEAPPTPKGGMSVQEARAILGVSADATREEIQDAYKRLIRTAHPDTGGTAGLAAQLNAARDVLLGR